MKDADPEIREAATLIASKLSGYNIQYLRTKPDNRWSDEVEDFRRFWNEKKRNIMP